MPVGRLVANCITPYRRLPAQKTPGWSDPTKATFQNSSRAPPTSLESPQSKSSGLGPSFGGLTRREGSSKIFPQKRTPSRKTKFAFATLSPYPCFTLAVHHARKEQDLGQMSHRNFSVVAAQCSTFRFDVFAGYFGLCSPSLASSDTFCPNCTLRRPCSHRRAFYRETSTTGYTHMSGSRYDDTLQSRFRHGCNEEARVEKNQRQDFRAFKP